MTSENLRELILDKRQELEISASTDTKESDTSEQDDIKNRKTCLYVRDNTPRRVRTAGITPSALQSFLFMLDH